MDDLTLDGLVMGAGLESSSHRHGLIPSRRFVRLDYIPVFSLEQMVETMEQELERQKPDYHDFVEYFIFSREEAVVMTGNMVMTAHTDKLNKTGLWLKS